MNAINWHDQRKTLAAALLAALVVTLWAGLHPFSFAVRNDVTWGPSGKGLEFKKTSMALSEARFSWDTSAGPATLGWELWLAPAGPLAEEKDILVLADEPEMPVLRLIQSGVDLKVASRVTNADGQRWYNDFIYPAALAGDGVLHVVLTSGKPHPLLHVNGARVTLASGYGIPFAKPGAPLSGRLLVGCGPRALGSWAGEIHGLVIHGRAPATTDTERGDLAPVAAVERAAREPRVVAAYAFTEGKGRVIGDLTGRDAALHLPEYYRPVETPAFGHSRRGSFTELHFVRDVAVNLLGLIPLGFLLAACLVLIARLRPVPTLLLVTAVGAGVSAGIEWVQVLMPTRDSSLLDFLLNTLGAALGAGAALRVVAHRDVAPAAAVDLEGSHR